MATRKLNSYDTFMFLPGPPEGDVLPHAGSASPSGSPTIKRGAPHSHIFPHQSHHFQDDQEPASSYEDSERSVFAQARTRPRSRSGSGAGSQLADYDAAFRNSSIPRAPFSSRASSCAAFSPCPSSASRVPLPTCGRSPASHAHSHIQTRDGPCALSRGRSSAKHSLPSHKRNPSIAVRSSKRPQQSYGTIATSRGRPASAPLCASASAACTALAARSPLACQARRAPNAPASQASTPLPRRDVRPATAQPAALRASSQRSMRSVKPARRNRKLWVPPPPTSSCAQPAPGDCLSTANHLLPPPVSACEDLPRLRPSLVSFSGSAAAPAAGESTGRFGASHELRQSFNQGLRNSEGSVAARGQGGERGKGTQRLQQTRPRKPRPGCVSSLS